MKIALKLVLAIALLVILPNNCFAESDYEEYYFEADGLYYEIEDYKTAGDRKLVWVIQCPDDLGIQYEQKNIVIPKSVTYKGVEYTVVRIDDEAFLGCENLKSISVPSTVISIGMRAFKETGLKSISLSENLYEIGWEAFDGCKYLEAINIPASVEVLDCFPLWDAPSFREVTVESESTTYFSFAGCLYTARGETLLYIPAAQEFPVIYDSCRCIKGGAGKDGIFHEIVFPESIEEIDSFAFTDNDLSLIKFKSANPPKFGSSNYASLYAGYYFSENTLRNASLVFSDSSVFNLEAYYSSPIIRKFYKLYPYPDYIYLVGDLQYWDPQNTSQKIFRAYTPSIVYNEPASVVYEGTLRFPDGGHQFKIIIDNDAKLCLGDNDYFDKHDVDITTDRTSKFYMILSGENIEIPASWRGGELFFSYDYLRDELYITVVNQDSNAVLPLDVDDEVNVEWYDFNGLPNTSPNTPLKIKVENGHAVKVIRSNH